MTNIIGIGQSSYNGSSARVGGVQPEHGKGGSIAAGSDMRGKLRDLKRENKGNAGTAAGATGTTAANGILADSRKYAESIRTGRQKTTGTALQLKKLKYQAKGLSSKILRSKTSQAAKQAAGQAQREIQRLKRQKANGDADTDEVDAAIAHAKAMRRVALKKAHHLEQEEMASRGSSYPGGMSEEEWEDKLEDEDEADGLSEEEQEQFMEDELSEAAGEEAMREQQAMEQEMAEQLMARMEKAMAETVSEMNEELKELMAESLQEMVEEMGLEELSDALMAAGGDMDENDLKALKTKHRNKEMKEMVEADMEYLKAMFDHLEKLKQAGAGAMAFSGGTGGGATYTSATSVHPVSFEAAVPVDQGLSGAESVSTASVSVPTIDISL